MRRAQFRQYLNDGNSSVGARQPSARYDMGIPVDHSSFKTGAANVTSNGEFVLAIIIEAPSAREYFRQIHGGHGAQILKALGSSSGTSFVVRKGVRFE